MSRSKVRLLVGIPLLLAACEEAPVAVEAIPEPVADLLLGAPAVDRTTFVRTSSSGRPASSPLLTEGEEPSGPAQILNARTEVGFDYGLAYAIGKHDYYGHGAGINTTVNVTFDDQHLGSSTAVNQTWELLSTQLRKKIAVSANVRTDHPCGLGVSGASEHSAWWELFVLKGAFDWGHARASSTGGPVNQPKCGKLYSREDPTGEHRTTAGISCTYRITYDLDTLEIVDVELLYCQTTGGEEM